jgi:heterodisulfide reductase subunit B
MAALGVELIELEDWSCCGASAADAVSYLLSMVLPARNLALAQRMGVDADFVIPCSACYLNLRKVEDHIRREDGLLEQINEALAEEGLHYDGAGIRVRHLLDVMANDIGAPILSERMQRQVTGLRVAPYYGCQALRPYGSYDDPEQPQSMEALLHVLGAEVFPWTMGAKCCGAGLTTTKKDVGMKAVGDLLAAARGADCVVTVCPMCQMNLEAFQNGISRQRGTDLTISILYLPQLVGHCLGLAPRELGLEHNLALTPTMKKLLMS